MPQASHSPAHELLAGGQPARKLPHYWYTFAQGDIEWFVTDSRTRRNLAASDRRILDIEQEQALWLSGDSEPEQLQALLAKPQWKVEIVVTAAV